MKPVHFDGCNTIYTGDDYLPLHSFKDKEGIVASCWTALSWRERLRVFFSGKVYVSTVTFGKPLQPLKVEARLPLIVSFHKIARDNAKLLDLDPSGGISPGSGH